MESGIVTPDEIIDLPINTEGEDSEFKREETPSSLKKKEHHYEDIEDYVSKIAFDSEHVDRVSVHPEKEERNLQSSDPIFDEFSREFNKQIRLSLSNQDDSVRQELKKIPKVSELAKQISDEDAVEKSEIKKVESNKEEKPKIKEIAHKSFEGDMDDFISKIASDSENVERVYVKPEKNQKLEMSDPIFDEFSREFNKQIRKSLSSHDDSVLKELGKIPKIDKLAKQISDEDAFEKADSPKILEAPKEVEKKVKDSQKTFRKPFEGDIEDFIATISSDAEHVDRVHVQPEKNESKLSRQTNITDPIFDEFSREMNKQIRLSLNAQDDSLRHELMKKIPKIEELEKQISDEDREAQDAPIEVVRSIHLLAPISSIDSTSSDEDRAKLSMVAEESETSDSLKRKSFEHEPSLDILEVESLKIDDSDVETLIEDIKEEVKKEIKTDESEKEISKSSEMEIKPDEISSEIETDTKPQEIASDDRESQDVKESTEEQNVKEDVVIESNLESSAAIKINPRWSKMR
jgi:hypothetical protein